MPIAVLLLLSSLGCYPGAVQDGDERFKLRSAVHLLLEDGIPLQSNTSPTLLFLLSDSQFSCDVETDDPAEVSQLVAVQFASLYREGAHNLLLMASRVDDGTWAGEYPVAPFGSTPGTGRWSEGVYLKVLESSMTSTADTPYAYALVDWEQRSPEGDGELSLSGDETALLEGHFDLRDIALSGSFESTPCTVSGNVVANLLVGFLLDFNDLLGDTTED